MKKQTIIILLLSLLLLGALGYISYSLYQQRKQMNALVTFQQGAQYGYIQAVGQLYQEAVKCQSVPVTFQNSTINMVAVECFQNNSAR